MPIAPTGAAPAPSPLPTVSRRAVEKPPDPSPEQVAALEELEKEAVDYERDAKDYRGAVTRIIKHHYEERRRRILAALDAEINIEAGKLRDAREEAIHRLEALVARYSGPNAHPESTPDGMYRLAALYEERARESSDDKQMMAGLQQAIELYRQIVREYSGFAQIAGVYYYLGHALTDAGRIEEAQQVWRALVCHNHFKYPVPPDPKDPTKDKILRVPQDHSEDWWLGWMQRHPIPFDILRKQPKEERRPTRPRGGRRPVLEEKPEEVVEGDEEVFNTPYPEDCRFIAQEVEPGAEPSYVAEIWWQLGDYHFEELDPWGGPFNLNRAEAAYRHSLKYMKPPVHGVSMYKLAWTFYKQQRYRTAIEQYVRLLDYTDEIEKKTGDPGADFRNEAYAYVAGSLTFIDFEGPETNDPFIARNDIFDVEEDAAVIEQKMHVAIERIQDATLIPQDRGWTVEIYKALAREFKEYNHFQNLIEMSELILAKWPTHRDAPFIQNQIAEIYETLALQSKEGTAAREQYTRRALEARTKLAMYVGRTPWVEANKEDPEAIHTAERLVRVGLRRAAADHTNEARRLVQIALRTGEKAERDTTFEQALSEYRFAASAWSGYLAQDENADDAYESRFWRADAYRNIIMITVALRRMPSRSDLDLAYRAARDVRDSNENDKYLPQAAKFVVDVAFQEVAANYNLYKTSEGAQGLEKRTDLKFEGEGENRRVVKEPLPPVLQQMVAAWDEFIEAVPIDADPGKNHQRYAYNAGEVNFLYGQFEEARRRLSPIYASQCGVSEVGYQAWAKLLTMANLEENIEQSRALAKAAEQKTCALDEEQRVKEEGLRRPTLQRGYYIDAGKVFTEAEKMPEGEERDKMWRRAAALYREALDKAPDRDEAPEAAMNGAFAYKQVGEYDKAIAMYKQFIEAYGNEEMLDKLENGDPKADPPKPPDPKRHAERVTKLKLAYDTLATAYVLFFSYPTAAETFDKISRNRRFESEARRDAARNAVVLYANMGNRAKMISARDELYGLGPSAKERAEIDWLVASADLKAWDERGVDRGTNQAARLAAGRSMEDFYQSHAGAPAAAAFTVQAAYQASKLRRAGSDPRYKDWCDKTISAFAAFKRGADVVEGRNQAVGSLQADMAAECEYRDLDAAIKKDFDYASGFHRYKGVLTAVAKEFKEDAEVKAKAWAEKLQHVITEYESRPWAVAARARQGSLYDSCRTGLYEAREPGLKLYDAKEEETLKKADKICEEGLSDSACDMAEDFRAGRKAKWRETRENYLRDADQLMLRGYVEAILWAKATKVRIDAVDQTIRRLAFFTDIIGDEKLRAYTEQLADPSTKQPFQYQDGMFLCMRRGQIVTAEPKVLLDPLPVVVQ
ncbi:MAG: tetratricopeptide repeat protein [Deltaproteobacteria bacterium]|nr:tetratricopeptide repeat protein [Deltaproteobacteria bacterium]